MSQAHSHAHLSGPHWLAVAPTTGGMALHHPCCATAADTPAWCPARPLHGPLQLAHAGSAWSPPGALRYAHPSHTPSMTYAGFEHLQL